MRPTEEERRNDEKSLTFEINLKTGEKMIHAMRQKNNFDRATSVGGGQIKKFDAFNSKTTNSYIIRI